MMKKLHLQKGFTLIEMLLVTALLVGIAGLTIPLVRSFQVSTDVDLVTSSTVSTLRRARTLAAAGVEDDTWGVYIQSGSITLFKGGDYSSRDTSFDEIIEIAPTITPSGVQEVVFDKVTGFPQITGTITYTTQTNVVRSVTINDKGVIDY